MTAHNVLGCVRCAPAFCGSRTPQSQVLAMPMVLAHRRKTCERQSAKDNPSGREHMCKTHRGCTIHRGRAEAE
jgi:hypothetical protein